MTYAAIITVDLPGMDRPATVTLTLKPPDAVEVAPGEVKALRDCTLSDLQAFADAFEAELWERYHASTLSELAATEQAQLKITILGEAGEPLSAAQEKWLERAAETGKDDDEMAADESDGAALQTEAETEARAKSEPEDGSAASTEEESTGEPAVEEDGSAAPAVSEPPPAEEEAGEMEPAGVAEEPAEIEEEPVELEEESADVEVESGDVEVESGDVEVESGDLKEEVAEAGVEVGAPEIEAPVEEPLATPDPVETPVVEGAEPAVAPVTAPPAEGDIRVAGLRRPIGHPTPAAVDILINEPAFREAQEHALSSLDREVAGMLIGPQPEKQPDGRYIVHVTDIIAAKHTRMSGASVTYTPESWRYVTDVLDDRYPNGEAVIVGWYHTHPGFGIFLSGMDLFIHQNFFTQTWHVALVLDPRAARSGFFCWDRQQSAVRPYEFPWPRWAAGSW